jgi:hypothetical protein
MLGPAGSSGWAAEQKVNKLRADLTRRRIPHATLTGKQLLLVIELVGDVPLSADAIAMYPRPPWLELMVGPFPTEAVIDVELAEMRHRDDRADIGEWGHMGD